jgi:hypothetical protein
MTLCYPLSYGPGAAPSEEDGGTLEGGTDACSTLAQDKHRDVGPVRRVSSVTIDPVWPSPHRDAILSTVTSSPKLWEYVATRHRHSGRCAPYGLLSAAPSSQGTDND